MKTANFIWDTPRGKPECVILQEEKIDNSHHRLMVIELTTSIKGDQFMKKGQRKVTTSEFVKELV